MRIIRIPIIIPTIATIAIIKSRRTTVIRRRWRNVLITQNWIGIK